MRRNNTGLYVTETKDRVNKGFLGDYNWNKKPVGRPCLQQKQKHKNIYLFLSTRDRFNICSAMSCQLQLVNHIKAKPTYVNWKQNGLFRMLL